MAGEFMVTVSSQVVGKLRHRLLPMALPCDFALRLRPYGRIKLNRRMANNFHKYPFQPPRFKITQDKTRKGAVSAGYL